MTPAASRRKPRPVHPLAAAERGRLDLGRELDRDRRAGLGQFFTPAATAQMMAGMLRPRSGTIRVLDPGAGAGALTAAWIEAMCALPSRPAHITLTAFEIDEALLVTLRRTLAACQTACKAAGVTCVIDVRHDDFIEAAVAALDNDLFRDAAMTFDVAILNPPYGKFHTASRPRHLLRRLGVETSNLYAAFLTLTISLLAENGEFVSITPRSFCNGPYFRPFREHLLRHTRLQRLHVFDRRDRAFQDDGVLQENVIVHAVKGGAQTSTVRVSYSQTPEDPVVVHHDVKFSDVVHPHDAERFIHLIPDEAGRVLAGAMEQLPCTLAELGLTVSTGRVVDFRARPWLCAEPNAGTVPLVYPSHFRDGGIEWPKLGGRKPNAISRAAAEQGLLVPNGCYVLVKRFSAKEEKRRILAAFCDPASVPGDVVGFENHLNYFHAQGVPMDPLVARGLVAFLASSLVDTYFRQFNGHTQVNAADLRMLRYPTRNVLVRLGRKIAFPLPSQLAIDAVVDGALGRISADA